MLSHVGLSINSSISTSASNRDLDFWKHACRALYRALWIYSFKLAAMWAVAPAGVVFWLHHVTDIINAHDICFHLNADNSQLYLTFDSRSYVSKTILKIQKSICDLMHWMTIKILKLSGDKTEIIYTFLPHTCHMLDNVIITIDAHTNEPLNRVWNLACIMDSSCSMKDNVTAIFKSAFYHLKTSPKSGQRWPKTLPPNSFMPSCHLDCTLVTHCSLNPLTIFSQSYSVFEMLLHVWILGQVSCSFSVASLSQTITPLWLCLH